MDLKNCGINTRTVNALAKKKLVTAEDFIEVLPSACRDFTHTISVKDAGEEEGCFIGTQTGCWFNAGTPSRINTTIIEKDTGLKISVTWFHQDFLYDKIFDMTKCEVIVCGKATYDSRFGYQITCPEFYCKSVDFKLGVYPKYRKIAGVSDDMQRSLRQSLLPYITENIEAPLLKESGLSDKQSMYRSIHFPTSKEGFDEAMDELRFRDLLYFAMNMQDTYPKGEQGIRMTDSSLADAYVSSLPYKLTNGQNEAVNVFKKHVESGNRLKLLIQGDVSCGKTSCALYALFYTAGNGYQAAIVAPTTVLAQQHYVEISSYVQKLNTQGFNIKVVFVESKMSAKEKRDTLAAIKSGEANIVVGTHATFTDKVEYANLATIVIDEEHRFGVAQREVLKKKAESGAHVISMSATPIPRSLAGTIYGEGSEVVEIKEMPAGRIPVKTAIWKSDEKVFSFVESQMEAGHQCYVVCPLVEDNDKFDKQSVETTVKKYIRYFEPKGFKVAYAHGKMKDSEMNSIINDFKDNKVQILIATTVIEVGVNVPNATVIVIENAEQFGLATLHQLRGRVGRGTTESYCILKSEEINNPRLQVIYRTKDGFEIAEEDMKLRGAGNLIGLEQTGFSKYLDEAIHYPEDYKRASQIARHAIEQGYTNLLCRETAGDHM